MPNVGVAAAVRRRPGRVAVGLVAAAVAAATAVALLPTAVADLPVVRHVPEPTPFAADPPPGDPGHVRVPLGADVQAVVDRHPAGTTFVLAAGVHREQRITPRDGDTFVGEPGAVLSGARVLDPADFTREGDRWRIGGQDQTTTTSGNYGCTDWSAGNGHYADCGHEAEVYYGEELFADGVRMRLVNEPDLVDAPGEWFYDDAGDAILVHDDPAELGVLEATTTDYAFLGEGVDGVTIADLVVRNYGSRAQRGAINGHRSTNWTITGVDASSNHGSGLGVGPGMQVTRSRFTDNGNTGVEGQGDKVEGGGPQPPGTPIRITHSEIARNSALGFQHGWNAGGIKLTLTRGTVFAHNWVHGNAAKGVWFDIDHVDATIVGNRVEGNGTVGIAYEISGPALIADNLVVGNHTDGDVQRSFGNIVVVSSRGVEVTGNLVGGGGTQELIAYHQDRAPGLHDLDVHGNHVVLDSSWSGGQVGIKDLGDGDPPTGNRFRGNTYHLTSTTHATPFHWDGRGRSPTWWAAEMGAVVTDAPAPAEPPAGPVPGPTDVGPGSGR